jgi:hypothetical protein
MAEQVNIQVEVPVRLRVPPGMTSVTAHQLVIHTSPDAVLLSFFEVVPPMILPGSSEEQQKAIIQAGVIAECVARIIVPKSKYAEFLDVMQKAAVKEETIEAEAK